MRSRGLFFIVFLITLLVILPGCILGPEYSRPNLQIPENYSGIEESQDSIANLGWWEFFRDDQLKSLIEIALQENRDLQIAVARIEEARALLGFSRADQFPRLDGSGNARRTDPSEEAVNFAAEPRNDFGLFGDLTFEVDIWGKLRRATEAQRAQLLGTEYARRAVTIALLSDVATAYIRLIGLDDRYTISKETYNNRKGATAIIGARFEKGIIPELDLNQAQIEEADAAVAMSLLEREIRQTENALSVLLGRMPFRIPRSSALARQEALPSTPSAFPAELLERRPDLLAAEETVKAAVARIGVAEAERLPSINLLGFIGLQSRDVSDLLTRDAFTWGIGADALGPLIDFGKGASAVEVREAQALQAYKNYEQSVLRAVQEVEDALIAIRTFKEELGFRTFQVDAARNAARLSRARYDEGVTSYLEVLDIERSLFQAELGASLNRQNYLNAITQLYKALGGGWQENKTASP